MKRIQYIFILFILFSGSLVLKAHPIKMTTGKLELNTQQKNCVLTLNFFIDDFESEMRKMYPQPPFDYEAPGEQMIQSIQSYILEQIEIQLADNLVAIEVDTIQKIEDNVCQVKLKGAISGNIKDEVMSIKNTLLFSSFDKQSNIIHVYVDGKKQHILQFFPAAPVRTEKLD